MHNYFTHTPVCVLGDKRKQKRYFLLRDSSLMKVFLGNNLGYWLHLLISVNHEEERFSAGWKRVSGNKKCLTYLLIVLFFLFTIGFKRWSSKLKRLYTGVSTSCIVSSRQASLQKSFIYEIISSMLFLHSPAFVSVIMLALTWLAQGHF